ncbi:mechanosensitive ion channel family protein [Candidatus Saccharibacteria bacterium oral taxon 488]|nr:mechanosensitive ion channel family protein [Candidatus Saccharibacteria bacterium oral taxon 488]QJU11224.1 mechanosensitive ion channel family protein [Candidatus Saccharibacteria bacterium oral taxon 488]QLF52112.1 mechanosensitive ion channel family protein [Candidatus Saccharibacteria bacterium oral taxon 488]
MTDTLIKQLLNSSRFDEWMTEHGLGWLVSERMVETVSIVIGAVIVYYLGRIFITWAIRYAIHSTAKHRSWHRKDIEKRENTLTQLIRSFWRITIIAYIAAMVASKLFYFDLSPLFASAGIIGVALGFGAQSLVKDFLAGIFIIAENQYRVGDVVDVMGASGTVERVGTRSTVLRDADGNVHYLPNGTIQHVINKTMGYSMSRFTLQLDPSTDISRAADIINETGQQLSKEKSWDKKIIEPPKFVSVGDITGRSVELIVAGKVQPSDQWAVTSEMRRRLLKEFEKQEIELAVIPTAITHKK